MFRRRRHDDPSDAAGATKELRLRALQAEPAELGLPDPDDELHVFGVTVDMSFPNGVATLVAFADGSTSLYTSTGFGIIGGGAHPEVAAASRELLRLAEEHRAACAPDASEDPPPQGFVTFRLRTPGGRLSATDDESVLASGDSPLSPVFHAAHDVITELRRIDEARRG